MSEIEDMYNIENDVNGTGISHGADGASFGKSPMGEQRAWSSSFYC